MGWLRSGIAVSFAVAAWSLKWGPAAAATPPEDFYNGKQIHLIVSTGPVGGYNAYARLIAQYMPSHIPGNPTIVVQYMDGASGIKATNYMYNIAARDGTFIAAVHNSIPTAPLLTPDGVQFDINRLSWIGSATKDPFVGYVWNTTPVRNLEDAKTNQIILGGNAPGAPNVDYVIVSNSLFGTKFRLINGYPGIGDINLAMARGELQGNFAVSWSSLRNTIADWLRDGQVRVIVQFGFERDPALPDVPLFVDQATNTQDRELLNLLLARQEFSKPYFAPPDVPAVRLNILRSAFEATMKDPNFLQAAKEAYLDVEAPMSGSELAALVTKLSRTPPAVIKRVKAIFATYETTK